MSGTKSFQEWQRKASANSTLFPSASTQVLEKYFDYSCSRKIMIVDDNLITMPMASFAELLKGYTSLQTALAEEKERIAQASAALERIQTSLPTLQRSEGISSIVKVEPEN